MSATNIAAAIAWVVLIVLFVWAARNVKPAKRQRWPRIVLPPDGPQPARSAPRPRRLERDAA
jgi:hypothetical protein